MSLQATLFYVIPEETVRVAKAAFPKGNLLMRIRDELGPIYDNPTFAPLFPSRGQPAEAPARLALVTSMQCVENLSDRQAADAVRDRLARTYALALELTDPGFDASVLSEFRARLIAGGAETVVLDTMLTLLRNEGLLKARSTQRTDSPIVLAAVRALNRLECVHETLRHALNDLARWHPAWLQSWVPAAWFERYSRRAEEQRFPKSKAARQAMAETIGADGFRLLAAVRMPTAPPDAHDLSALQILHQVWLQNYHASADGVARWRSADEVPPSALMIRSPYDVDARFSLKRETQWVGYKVHLTEVCDPEAPALITHVETTPGTTHDGQMTAPIHAALAEKQLLPGDHLVDSSYVDATLLVESQQHYGIDLVGPVPEERSWQAKAGEGFAKRCFAIDWDRQTVTCPAGATSVKWQESVGRPEEPVIHVAFARATCGTCAHRAACTRAKEAPRELTFRSRPEHEVLLHARTRQHTQSFKDAYGQRAGVEGTISQGVRVADLRHARYIGLAKTRLQPIATAGALNRIRLFAWFAERPREARRIAAFAALSPAG